MSRGEKNVREESEIHYYSNLLWQLRELRDRFFFFWERSDNFFYREK